MKNRIGTIAIPAGIVAIVVMMVVPIPTALLDFLIVANIAASILIVLASMYVKQPLEFSSFPSVLLIATLFRLALNISTTRLVLSNGYAGSVIEAFGHFVIGGSLVVGLAIFFILIVVQFIVITNGAGRVAEVGARFTLDAMPGKQMAIDADLNAGIIDEAEAKRRRKEISDEADFYGAMDGASKFVKGDAIAAVIIVIINLLGGFAIGMVEKGLSFSDAINQYALLSVGDGLVSQIPAMLISLAAGIIVTRAATENDLGTDLLGQFARHRRAMRIGGGAIIALALLPGMPKLPFIVVGGAVLLLQTRLNDDMEAEAAAFAEEATAATDDVPPPPDSPEGIAADMRVDPLELEIAFDLVELVDPARGGDLLDRVKALRRKLALELGVVIPLVRTRDNLDLPSNTYVVKVNGVEAGRGTAPGASVLVIGDDLSNLPGTRTVEPVFGLPAMWVPTEFRHQAEASGATVVDRAAVVTTHIAEVVRQEAGRLLSRQDVKALVETVRATDPVVVEELNGANITLGEVQRVLEALLDEGVSVRDLRRILEVLSERGRITKDPETLAEAARQALGPAISMAHATDGVLAVLTLEPSTEQLLLESMRPSEHGAVLAADPAVAEAVLQHAAQLADEAERAGHNPVLVCSPQLRAPMRRLIRNAAPRLGVLSYAELAPQLSIESLGVVNGVAASL
ncbi:MAG: flagellar biosynthesis protein FlhA [Acidimicrobiia bacterium]